MLFTLAYDLVLTLFGLAALPKKIWQGKIRGTLRERLGRGLPIIKKGEGPLIWIHAVSVGETKAAVPLFKKLKTAHPDATFVISSITETGHQDALKSLAEADYHIYLPFDLSFIIKPLIKETKPDLVILCETDLWINFLTACKAEGAKIILVNGKISEQSAERIRTFSLVTRRMFDSIDLFCLQNHTYKARFEMAGAKPSRLFVTGNMKIDDRPRAITTEEKETLRQHCGIQKGDLTIVVGSTHDPEELQILDQLQLVWAVYPKLNVILVPRHPERIGQVEKILSKKGIAYKKFSEPGHQNVRVSLVDMMGKLRDLYQIADIALVCGSYTPKVGGHNILEPCHYKIPVLFGPHMQSQTEFQQLMLENRAGLQVPMDHLSSEIIELLLNPSRRKQFGESGYQLIQQNQGATEKTFQQIEAIFNTPTMHE
jgi:3-deoxy-D-manno-octulosonic-acid transferase